MSRREATILCTLLAQVLWPVRISAEARHAGTDVVLQSYDSELAAVVAAVNQYNPTSIVQDREFIGAILAHQGRYYYSVTAGKAGHDQVHARIRYPKQMRLVALWHTHGGPGPGRQYFSDVDTQQARQMGKPFYLADYTGSLKVYYPQEKTMSVSVTRRLGLPRVKGYARGRVILTNMLRAGADGSPLRVKTS